MTIPASFSTLAKCTLCQLEHYIPSVGTTRFGIATYAGEDRLIEYDSTDTVPKMFTCSSCEQKCFVDYASGSNVAEVDAITDIRRTAILKTMGDQFPKEFGALEGTSVVRLLNGKIRKY